MFLTQEQTNLLSHKECQSHLKKITKTYNLDQPLKECWAEIWPLVDDIADTVLYLEDRMRYLEQANTAQNANAQRYGRDLKELV